MFIQVHLSFFAGTSDEDTPRTPVAIATYQQAMVGGGSVSSCSYSYSTGANCVTTQQRLTATTNQHSVGAEAAMTDHSSEALSGGGYFTRSQATRQAKVRRPEAAVKQSC